MVQPFRNRIRRFTEADLAAMPVPAPGIAVGDLGVVEDRMPRPGLVAAVRDVAGVRSWFDVPGGEVWAVNPEVWADAVSGLDSNPGTAASPVQTLQRALEILPAAWQGWCRCHLAAGPYQFPDRLAVGHPARGGEPCAIMGTVLEWPDGVRQSTGIGTSPLDRWLVQDVSLALVPDAYVGWFVEFTDGAHRGSRYLVTRNTVDTLELLAGAYPPAPLNGDSFRLVRPASVISRTLGVLELVQVRGQYVAFRDVWIDVEAMRFQGCLVYLDSVWLDSPTGYGVQDLEDTCLVVGSLNDFFDPAKTWFGDLPHPINTFWGGAYLGVTFFSLQEASAMEASGLVGRGGYCGVALFGFGDAYVQAVDLYSNSWSSIYVSGGASLVLGSGVGFGPRSTIRANGGNVGAVEVWDSGSVWALGLAVRNVHAAGIAVVVDGSSEYSADGLENWTAPSGAWGVVVRNGAYFRVATIAPTVSGGTGEVQVDTLVGTWALNRVSGMRGFTSARMDSGSPVALGPATGNGGTSNTCAGIGRFAIGQQSITFGNNLCAAGRGVMGTVAQAGSGVNLRAAVAGAGTLTLELSAPAGVQTDVQWLLIG